MKQVRLDALRLDGGDSGNVQGTIYLIAAVVASGTALGDQMPLRGLSTQDTGDALDRFRSVFAKLISASALDGVASIPALPAMTAPEAQA